LFFVVPASIIISFLPAIFGGYAIELLIRYLSKRGDSSSLLVVLIGIIFGGTLGLVICFGVLIFANFWMDEYVFYFRVLVVTIITSIGGGLVAGILNKKI